MSDKYKFTNDQNGLHFVTVTVVDAIDYAGGRGLVKILFAD